MSNPVFSNLSKSFEIASSNNSIWFGHIKSGNYIFSARGTQGVFVTDISDKSSPTDEFSEPTQDTGGSSSYHACRAFVPVGTPGESGAKAYSITRNQTYESSGATARIMEWDVDDGTWGASSPLVIYEDTSASANSVMLYSDMKTDGTYLFVAGQKQGVAKFDPADVSAGPIATNTTGDWETQGLALGASHVFYCNYGYGIRSVLKSDLSAVDNLTAESYGGKILRPWDAVLSEDEKYLWCTFNTSDATYSGIITYDVSDPANLAHVNTLITPASSTDNWNEAGDEPFLRLSKANNYLFCANGGKGIGVVDVSNPAAPSFLINAGNLVGDDTAAAVLVWQENNDFYGVYGDGYQPADTGTNQLYIDQVYPRGLMAFTIGQTGSTTTSGEYISPTRAVSIDPAQNYTAVAGDYVDEYTARIQDQGGPRTIKIALHTVSGGVRTLVAGTEQTIVNSNTDSVWRDVTTGKFTAINLTAGLVYTVCETQDSLTAGHYIAVDGAGTPSYRDDTLTGGDFNATFTDSAVVAPIVLAALGDNAGGGPISKPVTGGVMNTTAITPQRSGSPSPVPSVGGLSSSVIGVSPNTAQGPDSRVLSADQAADHDARAIGGLLTGGVEGVDFMAVAVADPASNTSSGKAVRYETATSPVASGGAFPNTYLNDTDPEVTVDTDDSTFSVEP